MMRPKTTTGQEDQNAQQYHQVKQEQKESPPAEEEEVVEMRTPSYAQRLETPQLYQVCVKCRSFFGSVRAVQGGRLVRCPVCGIVNPATESIARPHVPHQLYGQAIQWTPDQISTFLRKLPAIPLGSVIRQQLDGMQLMQMNQAEMLQLYQMDYVAVKQFVAALEVIKFGGKMEPPRAAAYPNAPILHPPAQCQHNTNTFLGSDRAERQ